MRKSRTRDQTKSDASNVKRMIIDLVKAQQHPKAYARKLPNNEGTYLTNGRRREKRAWENEGNETKVEERTGKKGRWKRTR